MDESLFAQLVVLIILIGFIARYIGPWLNDAIGKHIKRISDGLALTEQDRMELAAVELRTQERLAQGDRALQQRLRDAESHAKQIIEAAQRTATAEGQRILAQAKADAEQECIRARERRTTTWQRWRCAAPRKT